MEYGLYIETADQGGQIGLSAQGQLIAWSDRFPSRSQAALINLKIQQLMQDASVSLRALRYLCLCSGPGSYTGLRVGYATAKGLAYGLSLPIVAQSRLQLLSLSAPAGRPSALWIPAREGEYFYAVFKPDHSIDQGPMHLMESELMDAWEKLPRDAWTYGPLNKQTRSRYEDLGRPEPSAEAEIDFSRWAPFGFQAYKQGEWVDLRLSEPEYLKAVFLRNP